MDITTIGRGTIGGGLARLWEQAGHKVTTLGREGGDASNAEVVFEPSAKNRATPLGLSAPRPPT